MMAGKRLGLVLGSISVLAVAMLALGALAPVSVSAQAAAFEASMTGGGEVPPNDSVATGTFTATVSGEEIEWMLSVPAIEEATAAHLHLAPPGQNGPIVLTLYAAGPAGVIEVSDTSTAADLEGPLAGDFAAFLAALEDGEVYVNVHTVALPPGEIRGQVAAATQATPTATAAPTATPATTPTAAATPAGTATAAPTAAAPGPSETGSGGPGAGETATLSLVLGLVVLTAAVTGGGRLLVARRRTR